MIYLRADQDLEEQCKNTNAPPRRIWVLHFGLSAKPKHFEAGRKGVRLLNLAASLLPKASCSHKPWRTPGALRLSY